MKFYFIKLAIILRKILPDFVAYITAVILSSFSYLFLKQRRCLLEKNVIHLVGHKDKKLVREIFTNFALDYLQFLGIASMSTPQINRLGEARGFYNLKKTLALGRGAILISAHIGPWDLASCFLTSLGYRTMTLAESKGPGEKMYKLYSKLRSKTGMEILPIENRDSMKKIIKGLKENKILVLLGDRDITGSGVKVTFLDGEYKLPRGPALLALKYDVPIVTGFFIKEDKKYIATVEPEIPAKRSGNIGEDIRNLTQIIAQRLESQIKAYPTQWYVFQMDWQNKQ